jgi:glycogen(starch) synthase
VACFADLSHPDTAALLAGAQACVQAAHAEPFGLAVIEAGACGVPVAASSVSGHSELLRDRETGFLFRAGDVAACAAVLREMLGDRETAVAVANRFRAEVLRSFSWQDCARAYFALNTRD